MPNVRSSSAKREYGVRPRGFASPSCARTINRVRSYAARRIDDDWRGLRQRSLCSQNQNGTGQQLNTPIHALFPVLDVQCLARYRPPLPATPIIPPITLASKNPWATRHTVLVPRYMSAVRRSMHLGAIEDPPPPPAERSGTASNPVGSAIATATRWREHDAPDRRTRDRILTCSSQVAFQVVDRAPGPGPARWHDPARCLSGPGRTAGLGVAACDRVRAGRGPWRARRFGRDALTPPDSLAARPLPAEAGSGARFRSRTAPAPARHPRRGPRPRCGCTRRAARPHR